MVGAAIVFAAIILAGISMKDNMRQYVSITEARKAFDEVQVKGFLDLTNIGYNMDKQLLTFTLTDSSGERLPVVYAGVKPGNFEQAKEVVAIGHYDGNEFKASKLLVKCPSKYTESGEQI